MYKNTKFHSYFQYQYFNKVQKKFSLAVYTHRKVLKYSVQIIFNVTTTTSMTCLSFVAAALQQFS